MSLLYNLLLGDFSKIFLHKERARHGYIIYNCTVENVFGDSDSCNKVWKLHISRNISRGWVNENNFLPCKENTFDNVVVEKDDFWIFFSLFHSFPILSWPRYRLMNQSRQAWNCMKNKPFSATSSGNLTFLAFFTTKRHLNWKKHVSNWFDDFFSRQKQR